MGVTRRSEVDGGDTTLSTACINIVSLAHAEVTNNERAEIARRLEERIRWTLTSDEEWPRAADHQDRGARRWFRLYVIAGAGILAFAATGLVLSEFLQTSERVEKTLSDLSQLVMAVLAAIACWWTSRDMRPTEPDGEHAARLQISSKAWARMAWACGIWAAGQLVWSYIEIVLDKDPFPSLADPLFLVGYGMLLIAAWSFPDSPYRAWRTRSVGGPMSSLAICFLACTGIMWAMLGAPIIQPAVESSSFLYSFLAIYYVAIDVLIISTVLTMLTSQRRRNSTSILMLLAGFTSLAVADSSLAFIPGDGYETGQFSDLGWVLGFALIGLSALHPAYPFGSSFVTESERRARVSAPHLLALVYFAVLGLHWLALGAVDLASAVIAAILAAAVLRQQVKLSLENYALRTENARLRHSMLTVAGRDQVKGNTENDSRTFERMLDEINRRLPSG